LLLEALQASHQHLRCGGLKMGQSTAPLLLLLLLPLQCTL
jgi:hypothetical protein